MWRSIAPDIGRKAETFGGIVVGKLKLVAVPIDDDETAFRYTKAAAAQVVEIIYGS